MYKYSKALKEVAHELRRLKTLCDDPNHPFDDLQSVHQAYALLLEELDELWDEIKKKPSLRSSQSLIEEAVQISSVGFKIAHQIV